MAAAPHTAPVQNVKHGGGGGGNARPREQSVSFVRGSGRGRYTFEVQSGLTIQAGAQDVGPIDIKAYDYMRSITLLVQTTAAGAGTSVAFTADGPENVISYVRVKQPNGQTMYSVTSGFHASMIDKLGFYRQFSDPRSSVNFSSVGGSAPTFSFVLRIPFELDLRDALGALPNKDAAAPFTLELGINPAATVWSVAPTTSPTFKITPILEAYDQPPETLDGKPVDTTPPNMNTLQRWTEQTVTMVPGAFDARVRKLGNYVRELIFISKNSAGARIDTNGWADPVQIVLDEDVKDNLPLALWEQDIFEVWGYGGAVPNGAVIGRADVANGQNIGVWPYQYCVNERDNSVEEAAFYLPTIESEDYLLRAANWGSAVFKLTILKCEVLPRGDIFGDG
ncbi:MAG TPA: hypothetical protein VGV89_07160 [Thermoplasmata archaeon]|nr:hypothetical protein [Thermoplasmata archaeon]